MSVGPHLKNKKKEKKLSQLCRFSAPCSSFHIDSPYLSLWWRNILQDLFAVKQSIKPSKYLVFITKRQSKFLCWKNQLTPCQFETSLLSNKIFPLLSISAFRFFNLPPGWGGGRFRARRGSQPAADPGETTRAGVHLFEVTRQLDVFLLSGWLCVWVQPAPTSSCKWQEKCVNLHVAHWPTCMRRLKSGSHTA